MDPLRAGEFLRLRHPRWVNVVARTDDGRVVLIDQFRHGTQTITTEIPGGIVEPGEDPVAAGVRELREEAGCTGGTATLLGAVDVNPAIQDNRCYHVLVDGVSLPGEQDLDEHEEIAVRLVPARSIPARIRSGEITHSLVLSAFHLFALHENEES